MRKGKARSPKESQQILWFQQKRYLRIQQKFCLVLKSIQSKNVHVSDKILILSLEKHVYYFKVALITLTLSHNGFIKQMFKAPIHSYKFWQQKYQII